MKRVNIMQSYEFLTTAEHGYIRIPDEYKNKIKSKIKVIIVEDEETNIDWDALFPPAISTKGFKFNREEANLRGGNNDR